MKGIRELQFQAKKLASAQNQPYIVAENPARELGLLTLEGYQNTWKECGFRVLALAYPNKF